MKSIHPHQKLPEKAALEREYLAGASFSELGEKYGVPKKTVYNCMVRRARNAGTPWPLKQGRPGWEKKKSEAHRRRRDTITAMMIRLEIQDLHRAPWAITHAELAERAGVSASTIHQISSGHRKRVRRATAQAIMAVIERLEKQAQRPAGSERRAA